MEDLETRISKVLCEGDWIRGIHYPFTWKVKMWYKGSWHRVQVETRKDSKKAARAAGVAKMLRKIHISMSNTELSRVIQRTLGTANPGEIRVYEVEI